MLEIVGHTDSTGPEAYNLGLSERRAQAAANYLEGKGVSMSRITVKGMGESAPVASNATREGRAMNRRVEINTK
jgi:OOP family OmpA-OmpF porin